MPEAALNYSWILVSITPQRKCLYSVPQVLEVPRFTGGSLVSGQQLQLCIDEKGHQRIWGKEISLRWAVKRGKDKREKWGSVMVMVSLRMAPLSVRRWRWRRLFHCKGMLCLQKYSRRALCELCLGLGAGAQINTGLELKEGLQLVMQVIRC